MRVDGTHGLEPQGLGEGRLPGQAAKPPKSVTDETGVDSSQLLAAQAPYIQAALAADEVDASAVEEAKKLLRTGQLDTPQAVQTAAQRIIDLGI